MGRVESKVTNDLRGPTADRERRSFSTLNPVPVLRRVFVPLPPRLSLTEYTPGCDTGDLLTSPPIRGGSPRFVGGEVASEMKRIGSRARIRRVERHVRGARHSRKLYPRSQSSTVQVRAP